MKTHYDILGVARSATREQIHEAYQRIAASQANPLVFRLPDEVEEAYDVLLDPGRRADYDASIAPKPAPPRPAPTATPRPAASPAPAPVRSAPSSAPHPAAPVAASAPARPAPATPRAAASKPAAVPSRPPAPAAPRPVAPTPPARPPQPTPSAAFRLGYLAARFKRPLKWLVVLGLLWWGGSYVFGVVSAWIARHSRPALYSVRVTSKTGLNMREEPATSAEVAAKIPYFETIEVLADSVVQTDAGPIERWYEVTYDGSSGWVSGKHVKKL